MASNNLNAAMAMEKGHCEGPAPRDECRRNNKRRPTTMYCGRNSMCASPHWGYRDGVLSASEPSGQSYLALCVSADVANEFLQEDHVPILALVQSVQQAVQVCDGLRVDGVAPMVE